MTTHRSTHFQSRMCMRFTQLVLYSSILPYCRRSLSFNPSATTPGQLTIISAAVLSDDSPTHQPRRRAPLAQRRRRPAPPAPVRRTRRRHLPCAPGACGSGPRAPAALVRAERGALRRRSRAAADRHLKRGVRSGRRRRAVGLRRTGGLMSVMR